MKRKIVKSKPKKLPIGGALIGAGVSIGLNLLNASKAKKQRELASSRARGLELARNREQDILQLDNYPVEGNGIVNYYNAKGGRVNTNSIYNTKGGKLKKLASNITIAKGNKHNQTKIDNTSGIKLIKGNKTVAEIEGGEVIKNNNMVYSDRTKVIGNKTYADIATTLANKKNKIENSVSTTLNKKKLAYLNKTENALFVKQENEKRKGIKNKKNIPMGGNGLKVSSLPIIPNAGFNYGNTFNSPTIYKQPIGIDVSNYSTPSFLSKVGTGAEKALPYLDNIANAFINSKVPKIPSPHLQRFKNLKTKYNVNPELANINNQVQSAVTGIRNNTSNSSAARNEITSARLRGISATNRVLARQQNVETSLSNRNTLNKQNIEARNLSKLDAFDAKNFARTNDIQARTSANFANLAGDFVDNRNFKAAEAFNKERLNIARQDSIGGTALRADLNNPSEIEKLKNNSIYAKEQLKRYENYPIELAKLKKILGITNLATPKLN